MDQYCYVNPTGCRANGLRAYIEYGIPALRQAGIDARALDFDVSAQGRGRRRAEDRLNELLQPREMVEFPDARALFHARPGPQRRHLRLHGPLPLLEYLDHRPLDYRRWQLELQALDQAGALSAPTRACHREYLLAGLDSRDRPVAIFPNPVPARSLRPHRPRPIDVLFLGRPTRVKGFDLFLDLVKRLPPDLRIAAAGIPVQAWRTLVPEAVAQRVSCLGEVASAERFALLAQARVCVVPSRYESFSMVTSEALASGGHVVAWATGGTFDAYPSDLVHFATPFDAQAMAHTVMARLAAEELDAAQVDAFLAACNAAYVAGVQQVLQASHRRPAPPPRTIPRLEPALSHPVSGWRPKLRKLRRSPTQFLRDFVAKHLSSRTA